MKLTVEQVQELKLLHSDTHCATCPYLDDVDRFGNTLHYNCRIWGRITSPCDDCELHPSHLINDKEVLK